MKRLPDVNQLPDGVARATRWRPRNGGCRAAPIVALALVLPAASLATSSPLIAQASCPRTDRMVAPRVAEATPWTLDSREYRTWSNGLERSNLGVGFLEAGDANEVPNAADWLPRVRLPLFGRAEDVEPSAWIADGFWIPVADPSERRPLTYRSMVETSYEIASFVVVGAREDGWIQLYLDLGPLDVRAISWGHVWTHTCFLEDGDLPLRLVLWEDWFATSSYGVTFRDGSRHALRAGPARDQRRTLWVEGEDELEFLEISGDWARVRVSRPGRYLIGCLGDDWRGEEFEGWVMWRDVESGPWVWYPTRGC